MVRLGGALLAAVLFAGLAPGPAGAQVPAADPVRSQIEQETDELRRVRTELEQARRQAKGFAEKETKILRQLNSLDSELALKERLLGGLSRKENRVEQELEQTRTKLGDRREKLEERRAILRRRLRNIYKVGEHPGLQVLLGATSAVDLIRRFDWLLLVASQDRLLAEQIRDSMGKVREAEEELLAKQEEIRSIRRESEQEKAELVRNKDDRAALLQSVRTERRRHEKVAQELEQAEKDLQKLLADLERRAAEGGPGQDFPPAGTGFAQNKGRLPWPVDGKVVRWFGVQKDKRFGTSTFNGGIDIEAPRKSDVAAVHGGRADYVNWLPGYGQCIILNHGDGYYTLYAHTSSVFVAVGDAVAAGEVIATVGDTGSLLGNVLHFEIRKDAEPINPAPWMSSTRLR